LCVSVLLEIRETLRNGPEPAKFGVVVV